MERLEKYFSRQLEVQAQLLGERCPGEEKCRSNPTMPLFRNRHLPVSQICNTCKFKETKPGAQPRELMHAVATALELESMQTCSPEFLKSVFPEGLSIYQWICLRGLHAGRNQFTEQRSNKMMQDQYQRSEQARLERRLGR
jgi:hypothetical protein